jgi:hypothetical protein
MHLNDFRRLLIPGDRVRFFNLKRNVIGKVTKVDGPIITIEVDEAGEVKTYREHRKYLYPPFVVTDR